MAFWAPKTCLTYVLGIQKNRLNEMAFWAPKTCLTYALGIQKNRLNEMVFLSTKNLFNVCLTFLTWRIKIYSKF